MLNRVIIIIFLFMLLTQSVVMSQTWEDWNKKGMDLYSKGDYEEAIKCYDKSLAEKPSAYGVWYNRGMCYYKLGNFDKAAGCFNESLKYKNDLLNGWLKKGLCLNKLGKYSEAIKCFDYVLSKNPSDPDAKSGRDEAIKNEDSKVAPVKTDNKTGELMKKGNIYYDSGKYKEAIAVYESILLIEPGNAEAIAKKAKAEVLAEQSLLTPAPVPTGNSISVQPEPPEEIKISSLTHNATKPLKKGESLEVTLKGTGGGTAIFDITNFRAGIPMTEVQPGIYKGTYMVLAGDNVNGAYLTGHLSKAGKEAPMLQAGTVTLAGIEQQSNSPIITSVQNGQKITFPVEIKGYTKPYATVEIIYTYQTMIFSIPAKGVAGTARISADEKGYFSDIYNSNFPSGTEHTITVTAIDSSGNKSPETIIIFTQE